MAYKKLVPEAKKAMENFKNEIASEVGVTLKKGYNGEITARQAGSIGGNMVKKMIEKNQKKGWQFLFLGANIDAVEEAAKIGIRRTHAASYKNDSKGVKLNYAAVGRVMSCMRASDCIMDEMDTKISEFYHTHGRQKLHYLTLK